MLNLAADLADEVVVEVLVRRLVVGPIAAEVGPPDEPFLDENVEGAVDRRGVDPWDLSPYAIRDELGAQMLVGIGRENVPDRRTLACQASAALAQGRRRRRLVPVVVSMRLVARHTWIMTAAWKPN